MSSPLLRARRLAAALALFAAVAAQGCATPEARPAPPEHPFLVRAEQALLAGDEEKALGLYRAYRAGFAENPLASECAYWEGALLLKKGRLDEAEGSFKACLSRPRSHFIEAEAAVGLGDCRFLRDDYPGAIESYQRALDLRVPDARNDYALYRMGVARQRDGDWDTGRSCYQLLLRDMKRSSLAPRAAQRLCSDRYLHYQAGAFTTELGARKLVDVLQARGLVAKTVNMGGSSPAPWVVWVGDYASFTQAQAALPRVRSLCGEEVVLVP